MYQALISKPGTPGLDHRRQLGRERRALLAGGREALQLARLHVRDRRRDRVEHDRHVAAEHVVQGRRVALVRDVGQFDACQVLEQFARQMRAGAGTAGGVGVLARVRLQQRDQFLDTVGGKRRLRDEDQRDVAHVNDRRQVALEVVRQFADQVLVGREHRVAHQQRVSVGGLGDEVGTDQRARAGLVLDHDALVPLLLQLLRDRAREQVDAAAGRHRRDDLDRLGRPVLRMGKAARQQQRRAGEPAQPIHHGDTCLHEPASSSLTCSTIRTCLGRALVCAASISFVKGTAARGSGLRTTGTPRPFARTPASDPAIARFPSPATALRLPLAPHHPAEITMATKSGGGAKKTSTGKGNAPKAAEPPKGSKTARRGGTSAKGTMAGPSAKAERTQRGLVERAATALGSGTSSESETVRRAAVTERAQAKFDAAAALAESLPANRTKADEYALQDAPVTAPEGEHRVPDNPDATASTLTESNENGKNGAKAIRAPTRTSARWSTHQVDNRGQGMTTDQGVAVPDNENSLKAGHARPDAARGLPPPREDHALRPRAHPRARRARPRLGRTRLLPGATSRWPSTPAPFLCGPSASARRCSSASRPCRARAARPTPSATCAASRRSSTRRRATSTWSATTSRSSSSRTRSSSPTSSTRSSPSRTTRSRRPRSAHDTFWDFVSLTPETTHMLMWVMSDRAIPRSFRMMEGFGVHTFRLVNAEGDVDAREVPLEARCSAPTRWSGTRRRSSTGKDPDFHRRDLWEAIECGDYPEYELGVQLFPRRRPSRVRSFDVLDPTKLVPEELVPVRRVGQLVLDRNPDNFFAETEQVAFCTQHVVPGIDFTDDPLLQGRLFSYLDTQLTRLGGPNFTQIPINRAGRQVHNNQRDGFHQHQIHRGRANYEPNSLGGGCPFQAGAAGFSSFAERLLQASREAEPAKLRAKPEKFAEHYAQARLFFRSQSPIEQQHIIDGFRFELTRVQTPAVRARVVAQLRNVDDTLAQGVANGLGIPLPEPLPAVIPPITPEVERSPALSLLARPGDGSVATRRIALLVADGMDTGVMAAIYAELAEAGAAPRYVGRRLGMVEGDSAEPLPVEVTFEAAPSVLWDAVVLPAGETAAEQLAMDDQVAEFLMQQWRHNKAMLVPQSAEIMLHVAGVDVDLDLGDEDADDGQAARQRPSDGARSSQVSDEDEVAPGLLLVPDASVAQALERFMQLVAHHRAFDRFNGNAMVPPAPDIEPMESMTTVDVPAEQ